jgi:CheY-like chemotaxis protein
LRFIEKTNGVQNRTFQGDSKRISQILIQFVSNAVKFTETGFVELSIEIKKEQANMASLFFKVKDSGMGISLENQRDIYDSFKQLDGAMTRRHGGVGIGLAIVKKIVEYMGGSYGVHSELGTGSEFWFEVSLPTIGSEPSVLAEPSDKKENNKEILNKYVNEVEPKVLIVEDNKMNLKVLLKLLEKVGLQADAALNGLEAWEKAKETSYDLIRMDCQMPVMDGLESTRKIRAESQCSTSIIIAVTANALETDREACMEAGMDDFVTKPIKLPVLIDVLVKAFKI